MVGTYALQCCTVVSKTPAGEQKLAVSRNPLLSGSPLPYLTQLATASKPGMTYKVALQYTCDEWSSVRNHGLLNIGLSILTSWQEIVQAEMLPYMTVTNPHYFLVVIGTSTVLCLRLSSKVSKSTQPVTLSFS